MPSRANSMTYRLRKTLGGITTGDGAQKSRSIPDGDDPPFTKGKASPLNLKYVFT